MMVAHEKEYGPMTKRILELRSAEGGDDAKIFVAQLTLAYLKLSDRKG